MIILITSLIVLTLIFLLRDSNKPSKNRKEVNSQNRQDELTTLTNQALGYKKIQSNFPQSNRTKPIRQTEKTGFKLDKAFNYNVVGESYRRDDLLKIINKHDSLRFGRLDLQAKLKCEPTNAFDNTAVMVLIEGVHVGYIPKTDSARVTSLISKSEQQSLIVNARIGWNKNDLHPHIGVKLNLNLD